MVKGRLPDFTCHDMALVYSLLSKAARYLGSSEPPPSQLSYPTFLALVSAPGNSVVVLAPRPPGLTGVVLVSGAREGEREGKSRVSRRGLV